jgi:MFS family permease
VASALLMEFIDSTALSTALPTLARAFAVDPIHLKLALTSYILALAVFTPASGWAAERFGARRVFMSAMVVFLPARPCADCRETWRPWSPRGSCRGSAGR